MADKSQEEKQEMLNEMNLLIARLTNTRDNMIKQFKLPTIDQPKTGEWYILNNQNKYYQFVSANSYCVTLMRDSKTLGVSPEEFKKLFTKATAEDTERHLTYLASKQRVSLPTPKGDSVRDNVAKMVSEATNWVADRTPKHDFYMLSVGKVPSATTVRHLSYESAEKEAKRLCESTKQEVFMLGVVASVKPVEKPVTTITIVPTVVKR